MMSSLNENKILNQFNQMKTAQSWLNQPNQSVFKQVERRVIRQLLQAMLYENIVEYKTEKKSDETLIFALQEQTMQVKKLYMNVLVKNISVSI